MEHVGRPDGRSWMAMALFGPSQASEGSVAIGGAE